MIVPLNVLILTFSKTTIKEVEKQIFLENENALKLCMEQLDGAIERIMDKIRKVVLNNVDFRRLNGKDITDQKEYYQQIQSSVNLYNEYKTILEDHELIDGLLAYFPEKDMKLVQERESTSGRYIMEYTKNLIENHEEALNKIQQRLAELHNKTQSAVEKAEKTSIAAQELLQKLEQISQPLITATQQIKDAESAISQAQQNLALQEELLTETKDKRNIMQSQAINAQTKLLQALLNKTNSQEKLASAKEKLPMQTDALKYSSLINLEPLTIEPGETPLPKVTTAIAVENDHQNKAVITLPGDEQENKLPQGTKVVWKDDAKVATDLQRPGKHTEDVLIVFPDGSVILTSEQVTVSATEKQADANKETSPAQKTIDSTQENNMRANDLSAQVVEVNDDNQTSAPEILVTSQTKQHTVRPNGVIKGQAALNNIVQPSLAKSFKNKTTNNILPRTGDESSLPIIALGAVIGLVGIGATLKRYE